VSQVEREDGGLLGITWRLVGMRDDFDAFLSVLGDAVITAYFDEEGRISGSSGCNRYTGPATLLGDELSIGVVAGTRMMCSDPQVMAQESRYLGFLSQIGSYRVVTGAEGLRAEFLDTDGMLILEYVEVL
jgi:hypothetical protein